MKTDYDKIKDLYGEKMARFCRSTFPLQMQENTIFSVLNSTFAPTKSLYKDIEENNWSDAFIEFILDKMNEDVEPEEVDECPRPEELMRTKGYILKHCETEEDINEFKKYYKPGEVLCTFSAPANRLSSHLVFFAIKENIDEIKRENFPNPQRQDEYGTSCISIQFHKVSKIGITSSSVSIKNRYNHTVPFCDATFNNNLDNIVPGLKDSFNHHYNLSVSSKSNQSVFDNYIMATDGKLYRYNYERGNMFYCENNVVIKDYEAIQLDKARYEVFDNMILDKKEKTISQLLGDESATCFISQFGRGISKISVTKKDSMGNKLIRVELVNGKHPVDIVVNSASQMIYYANPNVKTIAPDFQFDYLQEVKFDNVLTVDNNFLSTNRVIRKIYMPKVEQVNDAFCYTSSAIEECLMNNIKFVGRCFLLNARTVENFNFSNLEEVGANFMPYNNFREIHAPKLRKIASGFLSNNHKLRIVDLPSLQCLPQLTFRESRSIRVLKVPKAGIICDRVLTDSPNLEELDISSVREIGDFSLTHAPKLKKLYMPEVKYMGEAVFRDCEKLEEVYAPKVQQIYHKCFKMCRNIKIFVAPNVGVLGLEVLKEHGKEFDYIDSPKIKLSRNFVSLKSKEEFLSEEEQV